MTDTTPPAVPLSALLAARPADERAAIKARAADLIAEERARQREALAIRLAAAAACPPCSEAQMRDYWPHEGAWWHNRYLRAADAAQAHAVEWAEAQIRRRLQDAPPSWVAENDRIGLALAETRAALRDLLTDTQHAEHSCTDPDCPVRRAREILEGDAAEIAQAHADAQTEALRERVTTLEAEAVDWMRALGSRGRDLSVARAANLTLRAELAAAQDARVRAERERDEARAALASGATHGGCGVCVVYIERASSEPRP